MPIAQDMKNITEEIEISYGERMSWLADLMKDTHQMMNRIGRENKEAAEDTHQMMNRIGRENKEAAEDTHQMMNRIGRENKEFLSESESQRLTEFKAFFSDVKKRTEEILTVTREDLEEARTHWQNLAKVMAAKRAGKPIPAARAEMGVSQAVKEEAEEAFEKGELIERVLKVIQAHPGGITLPEIGKVLRIAYIRISRPIEDLLEKMVITKRDSEYFPA